MTDLGPTPDGPVSAWARNRDPEGASHGLILATQHSMAAKQLRILFD
ncbi:hypothetical protein J2X72_004497 [Phyllobacterium sp. 1468]|nr:hypothetical protein [Phyllobacterium sp. 1468]MDR6635683.1 hypothetical protein [Phyllobacterium sp. 1468]